MSKPTPQDSAAGSSSLAVSDYVDALVDDYASDADVAELSALLLEDRSSLSEYVKCIGVHSALTWHCEANGPSFASTVVDRPGRAGTTSAWNSVVAVAASILVVLSGYLLLAPAGLSAGFCASIADSADGSQWSVLHAAGAPDMASDIAAGETIHLTSGELLLRFSHGAEVTLTAPAVMQVVSADRAIAVKGRLTAYVEEEAIGFSIDTPHAQVVDLGTRFGVEVDDLGQTDVVVFEGKVDLAYGAASAQAVEWKRRIMQSGEAVRVDDHGDANRIISVPSDRFAPADAQLASSSGEPIIVDIRDNIRGDESWSYYGVVRGGMREDALAFVDRIEHQWNGVDESGMPEYLVGGDYVRMFNNDKWAEDFELQVSISRPATLYVLFDDRVSPPEWLTKNFSDTGDDVGVDRGPYQGRSGKWHGDYAAGIGPGVSVEDRLSVWACVVDRPEAVRLGDPQSTHDHYNMYGIVAVPLLTPDG